MTRPKIIKGRTNVYKINPRNYATPAEFIAALADELHQSNDEFERSELHRSNDEFERSVPELLDAAAERKLRHDLLKLRDRLT